MPTIMIHYACGHGEGQVEVYGTSKERARRTEWLEQHRVCPDCWHKQKLAEAAKEGLRYGAKIFMIPGSGCFTVMGYFHGDTMPHKDEIKALGYRWGEAREASGLMGFFARSVPKYWHKVVEIPAIGDVEIDANKVLAVLSQYKEDVKRLDARADFEGMNILDYLVLNKEYAEIREKYEKESHGA